VGITATKRRHHKSRHKKERNRAPHKAPMRTPKKETRHASHNASEKKRCPSLGHYVVLDWERHKLTVLIDEQRPLRRLRHCKV